MSKKEFLITQEGLDKLKAEHSELVERKRPEIIARIKQAKELGDLSENAEYSTAKEEQSFIEGRIRELEEMIKHAKIVVNGQGGSKVAKLGSFVEVKIDDEVESFELVGTTESDPDSGKISIDSPVGKALVGHKAGDNVKVATPSGELTYTIISVK